MRRHALAVLLIAAAGIAIYADTLAYPFVFDDLPNITRKAEIRLDGFGWQELRAAAFSWPCPRRPLANLSFALDHALHGYDVRFYRAWNIAIHVANGILVYFLSLALLRRAASLAGQAAPGVRVEAAPAAALAGALLFVTHPVQLQSVVYVVQRMNSLAALFHLSALLLYLRARQSSAPARRALLFASAAASWLLALGSKETALVLPIAILLAEWFFFRDLRMDWLRSRRVLAGAALSLLVLVALISALAPLELLRERLLTQLRVVPFYVGLVLLPLPSRLSLIHDFDPSRSLLDPPTTLFGLLSIALVLGLAIRAAPRRRLLSFWVLWFFLHLAIESSVVGLESAFEYRLYLPMVGCTSIAALLLFHPTSRGARRAAAAAVALSALALGLATHAATRAWRDEVTLWSSAMAHSPRSYTARVNLGNALAELGRRDEAVLELREAIRLEPGSAIAHHDLGVALRAGGELEGAIAHFREASRIHPGSQAFRYDLADALAAAGQLLPAIVQYEEVLRVQPGSARAHHKLALLLDRLGRRSEAIEHLTAAVRLEPRNSGARGALNELLALEGRGEEAPAD